MDPIILTIILSVVGFFIVYGISKGVETIIVETGFSETIFLMFALFLSPFFAIRKTFEDEDYNVLGKIMMSISKFLMITPFSTAGFLFAVALLLIYGITLPIKMLLQCLFLNKDFWFVNKYKKARLEDKMSFQIYPE